MNGENGVFVLSNKNALVIIVAKDADDALVILKSIAGVNKIFPEDTKASDFREIYSNTARGVIALRTKDQSEQLPK